MADAPTMACPRCAWPNIPADYHVAGTCGRRLPHDHWKCKSCGDDWIPITSALSAVWFDGAYFEAHGDAYRALSEARAALKSLPR